MKIRQVWVRSHMYFGPGCFSEEHELAGKYTCKATARPTWDLHVFLHGIHGIFAFLVYIYVLFADRFIDYLQVFYWSCAGKFTCRFVCSLFCVCCTGTLPREKKAGGIHLNVTVKHGFFFVFFSAQLWLNFTAAFACTLYTELLQVVCSFTCESDIALGAVLQLRLQANWFTTSEPHVGLKYMQESS